MHTPDQQLVNLFHEVAINSPEMLLKNIPEEVGQGRIVQINTKHGVSFSDWQMKCHSDMDVGGVTGAGYLQIIFCMNHGIGWETEDKSRTIALAKGESCVYLCTDTPEHVCYKKGRDFKFKSVKIPIAYWERLLEEFLGNKEKLLLEKKLYAGVSPILITTHMEKVLAETGDAVHYKGGLGHLFLESKTRELIAVYFSEFLGLTDAKKDISLSVSEMDSLMEAKRIIDSRISSVPGCTALARQVNLNTTKFTKGFVTMYGMPVHSYVIDKRLEKAAALLMEKRYNVGQVSMMVGYSNASHFAAAFRRKYGMSPKRYMGA